MAGATDLCWLRFVASAVYFGTGGHGFTLESELSIDCSSSSVTASSSSILTSFWPLTSDFYKSSKRLAAYFLPTQITTNNKWNVTTTMDKKSKKILCVRHATTICDKICQRNERLLIWEKLIFDYLEFRVSKVNSFSFKTEMTSGSRFTDFTLPVTYDSWSFSISLLDESSVAYIPHKT